MNVFCTRGAKRWLLCAATGVILIRSEGFAADTSATRPEPARLAPAENSRPLSRIFARKDASTPIDGAVAGSKVRGATTRTADSSASDRALIVPTQNTAPAADSGQPTAIERELQKLYDRDGRKMPPMRKPIVPKSNAAKSEAQPQIQPKTGSGSTSAGQPTQGKPGVLTRLLPFGKKPAAPSSAPPVAPAPANPGNVPAVKTNPPAPRESTVPDAPKFEEPTPASGAGPFGNRESPATRAGNAVQPPAAPSADEFQDPFPEMSETQADDGKIRPRSAPAADAPRPGNDESERPPLSVGRDAEAPAESPKDENPFSGLKLDPPATPRREPQPSPMPETPALPAPSTSSSVPSDNPFSAPSRPAEPKAEPDSLTIPSPTPTLTREAPQETPSSVPEARPLVSEPKEAGPSFEAPTVRTPLPRNSAPPLTVPSPDGAPARNTEPDDSYPRATARDPQSPQRETEWSPTRPRTSTSGPTPVDPPTIQPQPQEIPRSQPPKPLDPEPAAEVPTTPQKEHERKLRLIAQRKGQSGFKGFCPVVLRDSRDLVDANPEFTSVYEGATYTFASADAKAKFDQAPTRYAPVSGGNDVMLLGNFGREVPGSLEYAVWYKGRLHLFHSRESLDSFLGNLGSRDK